MVDVYQNSNSNIAKIIYGEKNILNTVIQEMYKTKEKIDNCIDSNGPSLVVTNELIKIALIELKNRKIKLRFITEITKDNIEYCKELIFIIDEIRHLDGIKGNFGINETTYALLHN